MQSPQSPLSVIQAEEETVVPPVSTREETSGEVIGATLSREVHRSRQSVLYILLGAFIIPLLMALGRVVVNGRWDVTFYPTCIFDGLTALFLLASAVVYSRLKRRRRRRHMTASLAEQYDVRSIGPLIDALYLDEPKTREIALDGLIELLPRLKASDAPLLNERQRAKLCYLLGMPVDNPLYKDVTDLFRPTNRRAIDIRVAILKAFEQVGDSKALPIVERLAKDEAGTAGRQRIREAAQVCLPALQQRTDQERYSQTLLRATSAVSEAAETLLRPAIGQQEADPEKLLRPSNRNG